MDAEGVVALSEVSSLHVSEPGGKEYRVNMGTVAGATCATGRGHSGRIRSRIVRHKWKSEEHVIVVDHGNILLQPGAFFHPPLIVLQPNNGL